MHYSSLFFGQPGNMMENSSLNNRNVAVGVSALS